MIPNNLTKEQIEDFGYMYPKQLADGQWIALRTLLSTTAIVIGLDNTGYNHRYCYRYHEDALEAINSWDGAGHPPGEWIVRKGIGEDLQRVPFPNKK